MVIDEGVRRRPALLAVGDGEEALVVGPDPDGDPSYSPDGTRLAFKRGNNATGTRIWVLEPVEPQAILEYVAERVAPHKRIRYLEFTDKIPKSPSGKILRRVLVDAEKAKTAQSGKVF